MSKTREKIIETTCQLIEKQGYHATGLNEIVRESGTPKGSLYYYFPGGKEALAVESVQYTGNQVTERIIENLALEDDPAQAIAQFIRNVAMHVQLSDYSAGGPITTVALETATSSETINKACYAIYAAWQNAFAEKLENSGFAPDKAHSLAVVIIAALEGGIVLSRTAHDPQSLLDVASEIANLIQCAMHTQE